MMFIAGIGIGALVTMGVSFIFAADKNIVDEDDDEWYT
jgi:hypothetical protein